MSAKERLEGSLGQRATDQAVDRSEAWAPLNAGRRGAIALGLRWSVICVRPATCPYQRKVSTGRADGKIAVLSPEAPCAGGPHGRPDRDFVASTWRLATGPARTVGPPAKRLSKGRWLGCEAAVERASAGLRDGVGGPSAGLRDGPRSGVDSRCEHGCRHETDTYDRHSPRLQGADLCCENGGRQGVYRAAEVGLCDSVDLRGENGTVRCEWGGSLAGRLVPASSIGRAPGC